MDFLRELVLLLMGALATGGIGGSILFYRQYKRIKEAQAQKETALATKTDAEADNLTVSALGAAIELLRSENNRLVCRTDTQQTEIDQLRGQFNDLAAENINLRREMTEVQQENKALRSYVLRLHAVLVDLKRGISVLVKQICEAELEPDYTIPQDVLDLLDERPPTFTGKAAMKKEREDGKQ
jgi:chromosome segregation ATPase